MAQRPGIAWVDLDRLAWQTYAPGTTTHARLVDTFGDEIVGPSGRIDRARLARRAFSDAASLEALNAIVHPAVADAVTEIVRRHREVGTTLLLIEGALLASSPHVDRSLYDVIVWLEVPDEIRAERLRGCGRAKHVERSDAVMPKPPVLTVSGEGTVAQVADRLLAAVSGDGD